MSDRTMPHSVQAEQSVLGALLLDNDAIDRVGHLKASDFFVAAHRTIFAAIVKGIEAGQPVDPLTLGDALPSIGVGPLHELAMNTPSSANIGRYAAIVRERALRRGMIALASDLREAAFDEADARALLDDTQGKLDALGESSVKSEPVRVADDLGTYLEELERRREGKSSAIPTGFSELDRRLSGGIRRGEVVVVAARPKMGKSAFMLAVARNVAIEHTVLVLSQEMGRMQLHDRNLAALGRVNLDRLLDPSCADDDDWLRITAALPKLEALNLHIDDQAGLRLLDVRAKARAVKRRHGLVLLAIDYLQLMEADGDSRNAQIESITRGVKAIAKELNVGVLLLSQLNRELERRADKRPMPADLRDSGAIEQDCDAALFLYRDEVYNPDTLDRGVLEVNIGLNRQGATGTIGLAYIGEQTRVESLEHGTVFGRKLQPPRFKGLRD